MKRTLGLTAAMTLTLSAVGGTALAAPHGKGPHVPEGRLVDVQLLDFSDFHGHLADEGAFGGAAHLAGLIEQRRAAAPGASYTFSTGDNIGGSTFMSGLFQDEPTIEALNLMGLTASAVGNHEFDEGAAEFARMVEGGNHPELGQFGDRPYAGTEFPYLAANMVSEKTGRPITQPYVIEKRNGINVGIIGVQNSELDTLVSPAGIKGIKVLDEADTINTYAAELQAKGVQAIVALVHEGGTANAYPKPISAESTNGCNDLDGKIVDINQRMSPAVDVIFTGHTHFAFTCSLPDPAGVNRPVTGPGDWGRVLTEVNLKIDRKTKDVVRERTQAQNLVVSSTGPVDQRVLDVVNYWKAKADVVAKQVVGSTREAIGGDASGNRGAESAMGNLVADSILAGTKADGAQIAFMNLGGVRASLDAGDVTYAEAYAVLPFGNQLVTVDMTGAQIEALLNQQYNATRSRQMLALAVSQGFTYTWDAAAHRVVPGSMTLNGQAIDANTTYKVGTLNFLADGGDGFTQFTQATNRVGGPEDLASFIAFLRANSPVASPGTDRVAGL